MKFSARVSNIRESETLKMAKTARKLKEEGKDIINLSLGEPDFDTPEPIKEAAVLSLRENKTHYPPVAGIPELRQAICDKLLRENDLKYAPENTLISAGAKHSITNIVMALVDEGDEVVIISPYWVSYAAIVELAGGTVKYAKGTIENKFKITAPQLKAEMSEKTTLVMFSSPCNPTGESFSRQELDNLAEVMRQYPNAMILSDEIYEYITFTGKHESIAKSPGMQSQTVIVNGASKGFAMTGWRLGWMAGPSELIQKCELIQGQMTSGINTITQWAMVTALNMDHEVIIKMKDIFQQRRDLVISELRKIPNLQVLMPEGAFYAFPEVSAYYGKSYNEKTINSAEDLSMYLLEEALVATVDGTPFGNENCLRISYAADTSVLMEAMKRLQEAFAKLN